jgi:hypothetical protein
LTPPQVFRASLSGPSKAVVGGSNSQALQTEIKGNGASTAFQRTFLQVDLATPSGSNAGTITGTALLEDLSPNSLGSKLILDLAADPKSLDSAGRPTHLTWTVNPHSDVTFIYATGNGTTDIRYTGEASPRHRGLASSFATVTFQGVILPPARLT